MSKTNEHFQDVFKTIDSDLNSVIDQYSMITELKSKISEDVELTMEEKAELIAFTLVDQFKGSEWGFGNYFGPQAVWVGDDGQYYHSPALNQITPEMLSYWEKRIDEVKHPFLIARYSGLVWDLSFIITGQTANYELRKKFIEASLTLVSKKLFKDSLSGSFILTRSLDIASRYNDKEFFAPIKTLIFELQSKYDSEDRPRTCVFTFDLLTGYKKLEGTEEEIAGQMNKMEEVLSKLCSPNKEGKTDPWAAEAVAKRLADYYNKIDDDKKNVCRVILMVGQAYEPIFNNASNFQIAGWLQSIYKLYKHFGLNDEADQIAIRMREMGAKSSEEMGVIEHKLNLPKKETNAFISFIYQGNENEIFSKIIGNFIPDQEDLKKSLLDLAKQTPFQFSYPTQIQDRRGRPIANIGALENDLEGQLVLRTSDNLNFNSFFLHLIFQNGISNSFLSIESILKFLSKSAIIEKDRLPILERALKGYFSNDFLVFIHIVIPQIEEAIRNLIEKQGGNVQKFKNGVFNLRTFDDILRDLVVKDILGINTQTYFRILFTDQRGWNIRNEVCHGMVDYERFDKQTADRILHSILCLGLIQTLNS